MAQHILNTIIINIQANQVHGGKGTDESIVKGHPGSVDVLKILLIPGHQGRSRTVQSRDQVVEDIAPVFPGGQ